MSLFGTTEITYHNGVENQNPTIAVYFDLQLASEFIKRLKVLGLEILNIEVTP